VSFTGHQFDAATGLVYARARYYDPVLGRFLSQDPVAAINPYAYVLNSPIDLTDPSGAESISEQITLKNAVRLGTVGHSIFKLGKAVQAGKPCQALTSFVALGASIFGLGGALVGETSAADTATYLGFSGNILGDVFCD
jgi:RHS repeat-associated protein